MEENATDGMFCIRKCLQAKGVPEEVRGIMLQSWRKSTQHQYEVYLNTWSSFCSKRKIDSHDISVNNVLKFLTFLYELGLGYSSLNTAHSALSSLDCGSTCSVGNHPLTDLTVYERGLHFEANEVSLYHRLGC